MGYNALVKLEGEAKLKKIPKQEYTAEFKELAVKRVKAGQSIGAVARELGLIEQTLRNWVKAAAAGKLNGPGSQGGHAGADGTLPGAGGEHPAQAGERNPKKSDGILREGCAVKYAWIDAHRRTYGLAESCAVLAVSISGYQAWKRGGSAGSQAADGCADAGADPGHPRRN